jgi:heterodisulfide reductase subunit C
MFNIKVGGTCSYRCGLKNEAKEIVKLLRALVFTHLYLLRVA